MDEKFDDDDDMTKLISISWLLDENDFKWVENKN